MPQHTEDCFTRFAASTGSYPLPQRFNYPFNYEPHPLCKLAARELQGYIQTQTAWKHDFGTEHHVEGTNIGKMFGVLLVKNQQGELGYLSAFSGKLAGGNQHERFVPPVVDLLQEDGFYRRGEDEISTINQRIEMLETTPAYIQCLARHDELSRLADHELTRYRQDMKAAKQDRDTCRQGAQHELCPRDLAALKETLKNQSLKWQYDYKLLAASWRERLEASQRELDNYLAEISRLKEERKVRSAELQRRMFDQYQFLDGNGQAKSLHAIFQEAVQNIPPAGAGDCAGPKLLQYAYLHQLQPLSMAEFWWGQSPGSEIRKHGCFYPACRGKCQPILGHMLQGLNVDANPQQQSLVPPREPQIIFEDDAIMVINKPAEYLSVPGKTGAVSVSSFVKEKRPGATGPLIVHRLDMSTSGLMIVAKTVDAYHNLQDQFLGHSVKKRYVALLEGLVPRDEGVIDLPLRVDLDNRPQQLVCHDYGKPARTRWEVLERTGGRTRILFYPITGRTHQLRVHASHPLGLNCPIVGDDLYGQRADRLLLHAEYIEFTHPVSNEQVRFQLDAGF